MTATSASSEVAFVACNIYISSASSANSVLQNLLKRAQDHCCSIRRGNGGAYKTSSWGNTSSNANSCCIKPSVAVIHAFADVPYNRSSFHLAGRADCVADVALKLILNSFDEIEFDSASQNDNAHPFVGLVDHVSIMPMVSFPTQGNLLVPEDAVESGLHPSQMAAVAAAKTIGGGLNNIQRQLTNVHYYGLACPNKTSLARVRREKTTFFNCGDDKSDTSAVKGDCTIGVPRHFVENYNIRLSPNVDFEQAKTLTQHVRGRNIATKGYGIEGVEALTLPYQMPHANGGEKIVYEVACNLTDPSKGSAHDIEETVGKWIEHQTMPSNVSSGNAVRRNYLIDKMYRVGTTEKQCVDTLLMGCNDADETSNSRYWKEHDACVLERFQQHLTGVQ